MLNQRSATIVFRTAFLPKNLQAKFRLMLDFLRGRELQLFANYVFEEVEAKGG
jgi:hypothetical protein